MPIKANTSAKPIINNAHYRLLLEGAVASELGIDSKAQAKKTVDAVLNALAAILTNNVTTKGFRLQLTGLGTFSSKLHQSRPCRNPKTGEKLTVGARHKMHLKVSTEIQSAGVISQTAK